MAKPKFSPSKPGKTSTASLQENAAPDTAGEVYNPSTDRASLDAIVARRGPVEDAYREAFDELISDADRANLGSQTKAAGVLHDAVTWAIQIDKAFTEYPALTSEHYSAPRFQYYLDRSVALADRLSAEAERRGAGAGVRTSAAQREKAAREKRDALIDKLRGFAGQRRSEKTAITTAAGQTGTPELLGKSIANLASLAREWLARKDTKSVILAQSAGLTEAVVADAMKAAQALTGAATSAQLGGRLAATDSPEVNVLEGTVLHEMDEAERCFRNMRKHSPVIGRLVPGSATRHVLGSRKGSSGDDVEVEEPGEPAVPVPA